MKIKLLLFVLTSIIFAGPVVGQISTVPTPSGAWVVTYNLGANANERVFQFASLSNGTGVFRFRTVSATARAIFPAVWARTSPNTMSFTAEVALPVSATAREFGTLVFKGTREPNGNMSGPVIFIVDAPGPVATPLPYAIRTGTFTAVPLNAATGATAQLSGRR